MRQAGVWAIGAALLVVGCGKSGDAGGGSGAAAVLGGSDWKATDACALLPKEKVAAAIGQPVKEATLDGVMEGDATSAAASTCSYTMADGSTVGVLTRLAPNGDGIDQAIKQSTDGGGLIANPVVVPGLGRHAVWSDQLHSLQVFLDDRRYAAFTMIGPKPGVDAKGMMIALAKSFGS